VDVDGFWAIIARSDSPTALHEQLAALPEPELADFEVHHQTAYNRAYDWGLWGAAYVIAGGCSDDSFDYFRGYLIGLGKDTYEAALADPDSLAEHEDLDDGEEWEDWVSPVPTVVHARTGEYDSVAGDRLPPYPSEPTGEDWEEDDLPRLLPRLTAKYE
jgi:hypothetical protein